MKEELSNDRPIYCPGCGRKVGNYDGKSKINKSIACRKCNRLVVYNVFTGQAELKPIPRRTQASGMRFY